jgi:hypothetical protein
MAYHDHAPAWIEQQAAAADALVAGLAAAGFGLLAVMDCSGAPVVGVSAGDMVRRLDSFRLRFCDRRHGAGVGGGDLVGSVDCIPQVHTDSAFELFSDWSWRPTDAGDAFRVVMDRIESQAAGLAVECDALSDGSEVWNVRQALPGGAGVTFACVSRSHADALVVELSRCSWVEVDGLNER